MKVIKYNLEVHEKENILVPVVIDWSESNELIAQKEAFRR